MPNPVTLLGADLKAPPPANALAETTTPGEGLAMERINISAPLMPIPAGTGGGTCQASRGIQAMVVRLYVCHVVCIVNPIIVPTY